MQVHYTGRLEDGQVFDTSEGRDPLTFTVGAQQVIPGFESAVAGKDVGDKATAEVPPAEGYGEHDPQRVLEIERERLTGVDPEVGQVLGLQDDDGRDHQATVIAVTDDTVRLDFNHFLAGKTLLFDIEVVAVS